MENRGGAREGAGAPAKDVKRNLRIDFYTTSKDKSKEIKDQVKNIQGLLSTKDNKVFQDDILLEALKNYKNKITAVKRAEIESKFDSSYTISNAEIAKTRMSKKLKELIEKEEEILKEKNIDYLDIYSYKNEFIVIKLNTLISVYKSIGNFKDLDEYQNHQEELDYIEFLKGIENDE